MIRNASHKKEHYMIFHWHYHSGRTMALKWAHPLTKMSRADNFTTFMYQLLWNVGALEHSGLVQASTGIDLPFSILRCNTAQSGGNLLKFLTTVVPRSFYYEQRGIKYLWHVAKVSPAYTASYLRSRHSVCTPPWRFRICSVMLW
jgi:hypothetical protein